MNKYKLEDYLPEEEFNQIDEPEDPQHIDDIPSVKLHVDDNENLTIQISAFYHGPENKKIPLLVGNKVLQDLLLKAFQVESQKMFRRVVHGVLGEPYGLPESKTSKTMTNETKLWQLRAGLITESEYQEAMEELNPPATPSSPDTKTTTTSTDNKMGLGGKPPASTVQALGTKLRDIGNSLLGSKSLTKGGPEVNMGAAEIVQLELLIKKLLQGAGDKTNTASGLRQVSTVAATKIK